MTKTTLIERLKNLKNSYKTLLNQKFERYFCYQYFFEGDDEFTIKKQRVFFLSLYRYNKAAISKFGIGGEKYNKVVYVPLVKNYGVDGTIIKAAGILGVLHLKAPIAELKTEETTKKLDSDNAVFCEYELSTNKGLYFLIQPLLEQIADDFIKISLSQNFTIPKFVWTNYNADRDNDFNAFEEVLYDFDSLFVKFKKENEKLLLNNDKPTFEKITFITPTEIAQKISNIKNKLMLVFQLLGVRATINFKKERAVTAEIEQDDAEFLPNEIQKKQVLTAFVKDYNDFYGTNISLIDKYEQKETENREKLEPEKTDILGDNEKGENNGNDN